MSVPSLNVAVKHTSIKTAFNHPLITQERWELFSPADHQTWHILFKRQQKILVNRAADEIFQGMEKLLICAHEIPKLSELNAILMRETGFSIIPVKGFIPEDLFFQLLSERKFPVTGFIRKPHQLDYLEEPDIFHDVFGHVPLLVNPLFADFMEAFGQQGLLAIRHGMLKEISALYWFTVEFGLIATSKGLRIYGAGITSSKGECLYALESSVPNRLRFEVLRAMKTQFHIDAFQLDYFVIESFDQLFKTLASLNWQEIAENCHASDQISEGVALVEELWRR